MSEALKNTRHPLDRLRDPGTVRARCRAVLRAVDNGVSEHFRLERAALPAVADRVAALTLARFPDLRIPYHSRWRHFEAGGTDRKAALDERLGTLLPAEKARAWIDLALVSVLLDAGAGPAWGYDEAASGQRFTRSEGLGVASFHAFAAGLFSSDAAQPLRADAAGLQQLRVEDLASAFQVTPGNPLVGLEGRVALLHRLGAALQAQPAVFGTPAVTTRGFGVAECEQLAGWLCDVLDALEAGGSALTTVRDRVREQVVGLCRRYPVYR